MHSNSSVGTRLSLALSKLSFPVKTLILASTLAPFHTINASNANQYDRVLKQNKLTVVAVESPTTVFKKDRLLHGFGYDLVRNYAQSLNVRLEFKTVSDNATALKMVKQGKANFAMTTASLTEIEAKDLSSFSASCGDDAPLQKNGLDTKLNWVFEHANDPLAATASGFVCQGKQAGSIEKLASFYNRNVVAPSAKQTVYQNLSQRLPIYQASFKQTAKQYNLDWHLLAAIGYQESYLKPESVSPTGVRGLMMLTNNTAKAMGVTNRVDPHQSIQGGAKYYDQMLSLYENVPYPDRNWYALVAYNMGPGAVSQIQKRLKAQGQNPNNWIHLYSYLEQNKARNGRYRQAVQYVTRIRSYVEQIKTTPQFVNL